MNDLEPCATFEEAWQQMIDRGYIYGQDALEQVAFGYELAVATRCFPNDEPFVWLGPSNQLYWTKVSDIHVPLYIHPDPCVAELEAEVERLTLDGIHTCSDACQRPTCVLRRENAELTAKLAALKAAGDGLDQYAGHWDTCEIMTHGVFSDPIPCTCGYHEALAAWEALTND